MKIICNKKEFAEIVRSCYKNSYCADCALNGMCGGQDSIIAFTDKAWGCSVGKLDTSTLLKKNLQFQLFLTALSIVVEEGESSD